MKKQENVFPGARRASDSCQRPGFGGMRCDGGRDTGGGRGSGDGGALGGGRGMDRDRYEASQQTVGWCLRSTSMLLPCRLSPDYQMARQGPLPPPARCHLLLNNPVAQRMCAYGGKNTWLLFVKGWFGHKARLIFDFLFLFTVFF